MNFQDISSAKDEKGWSHYFNKQLTRFSQKQESTKQKQEPPQKSVQFQEDAARQGKTRPFNQSHHFNIFEPQLPSLIENSQSRVEESQSGGGEQEGLGGNQGAQEAPATQAVDVSNQGKMGIDQSFVTAQNQAEEGLSMFDKEQADEYITTLTVKRGAGDNTSSFGTSDHVSDLAVIDGKNTRPGGDIIFRKVRGFKQQERAPTRSQPRKKTTATQQPAIQDQIIFSNLKVDLTGQTSESSPYKSSQVVNQSRLATPVTAGAAQIVGGASTSSQEPVPEVESEAASSMDIEAGTPIAKPLLAYIENFKSFPFDNQEVLRQYLNQKGLNLFDVLKDKISPEQDVFDKRDEKVESEGGQDLLSINGSKFSINNEYDFSEWERYDIQEFKDFKVRLGKTPQIKMKSIVEYLRDDLQMGRFQEIDFKNMTSIKSGLKIGRKLSDADSKWVEKWFEVKLSDSHIAQSTAILPPQKSSTRPSGAAATRVPGGAAIGTSGQVSDSSGGSMQISGDPHDLIIKSQCKFWTKIETNQIEGESCLQILSDGSKIPGGSDNLEFEIRESYVLENILNKEGSLKQKAPLSSKAPVPIQDSKKLAEDLNNFSFENKKKQQLESKPSEVSFSNQQQQSTQSKKATTAPAGVPADVVSSFDIMGSKEVAAKQVFEESFIADKWANSSVPFHLRHPRVQFMRAYLTQFDGSQGCNKQKENGAQHEWTTDTAYKSSTWKTNFIDKIESIKEIIEVETDKKKMSVHDPNIKKGQREGTNKYGQHWKEDWEVNMKTGVKKWTNMTQEFSHLRNDGFESRWGQSKQEIPGEKVVGDRWTELIKESEDYWERKSERYTEYAKKTVDDLEDAIDTVLNQPKLVRSGISEFKNNRNYLRSEQWEEYMDGTLLKNVIHDNGFGRKVMEQQGKKLNFEKLGNMKIMHDSEGFFAEFVDDKEVHYKSLQDLIEGHKAFLQWEYNHETVDAIHSKKIIQTKMGQDYTTGASWNNEREMNLKDGTEKVKNTGSDIDSKWTEEWKQKRGERWAKKEGHQGPHHWKEQWYQKMKKKPKKKIVIAPASPDKVEEEAKEEEVNFNLLDQGPTSQEIEPQKAEGEESDGSLVEESNSEKWGKNDETQEEWHEKWGEVHRTGEKQKWCDKWQIDLRTGLKKGENWGQTYTEDYQIKEHWAEKWDDRHPENHGVYERRYEVGPQKEQA